MDMDREPLAVWEYELRNLPVPPDVAERQAEMQASNEAVRQEEAEHRAAQAQAWPMLHEIADGGQTAPGGTVDLTHVWPRLDDVRWETRGLDLVEALAERAGGLANRLLAGCRSLLSRRDGNVTVYLGAHPNRGTIDVYAWSTGGCWSERAWWLHTGWDVDVDEWGEVRLSPIWGATLAVRGRGGTTVFEDDENGPLAEVAARWYLAWEGRHGIRARLGLGQSATASAPLVAEEFLAPRA